MSRMHPKPTLTRRTALQAAATLGVTAATRSAQAADLVPITFQLDWIAYGRHVPYYVALKKGFYSAAGMDVKIEQGTGAMAGFRYLAAGRAQFIFQDIGSLIALRARDDMKIKAVCGVYQKPPHTAFYIKGKGITTPKDFEGRKIATSPGSSPKVMFPAFAAANNIDEDKVSWLSTDPNTLNSALLTHQADGMVTYLFTLPVLQKAAQNGEQIGAFTFGDFGVDFYANAILAMEEYITANPTLVRGFVQATKKGFEYTMAHREESVAIMKEFQPQLDLESAMKELDILEDLTTSEDTKKFGFGTMTDAKMKATEELTVKYLQLPGHLAPADLYTNAFLTPSNA